MNIENFVVTWAVVGSYQGMQVVEKSSGISRETCESIRKNTMIEVQNAARGFLKEGEYLVQFVCDPLNDQKWMTFGVIKNIGIGLDGRGGTLCAHYAVINTSEFKSNMGVNFTELFSRLNPDRSYCKSYPAMVENREKIEISRGYDGFKMEGNYKIGGVLDKIISAALKQGNNENRAVLKEDFKPILFLLSTLPVEITSMINLVSRLPHNSISLQRPYSIFTNQQEEIELPLIERFNYSEETERLIRYDRLNEINNLKRKYSFKLSDMDIARNNIPMEVKFNDVDKFFHLKKVFENLSYSQDYLQYMNELEKTLRRIKRQRNILDYSLNLFSESFAELIREKLLPSFDNFEYRKEIAQFPDYVFGKNTSEWKSFLIFVLDKFKDEPNTVKRLKELFGIFSREELEKTISEGKYDEALKLVEEHAQELDYNAYIEKILISCNGNSLESSSPKREVELMTHFLSITNREDFKKIIIDLLEKFYINILKMEVEEKNNEDYIKKLLVYDSKNIMPVLLGKVPDRIVPLNLHRKIDEEYFEEFLMIPFSQVHDLKNFTEEMMKKARISFSTKNSDTIWSFNPNILIYLMSAEATFYEVKKTCDNDNTILLNNNYNEKNNIPLKREPQGFISSDMSLKHNGRNSVGLENRDGRLENNSQLLYDMEQIQNSRQRKERKALIDNVQNNFNELIEEVAMTGTYGFDVIYDLLSSQKLSKKSYELLHDCYENKNNSRLIRKRENEIRDGILKGSTDIRNLKDIFALIEIEVLSSGKIESKDTKIFRDMLDSFVKSENRNHFMEVLGTKGVNEYPKLVIDFIRLAEDALFSKIAGNKQENLRGNKKGAPQDTTALKNNIGLNNGNMTAYLEKDFIDFMKFHLTANYLIGLKFNSNGEGVNLWDDVRRDTFGDILKYFHDVILEAINQ
jgi:hypothetical protein